MYTQPDSSRYEYTARALQWLSDNSLLWTMEGRGVTPRISILEREVYTASDLVAQTMDPVWAQESSADDAISALAAQWQVDLDAGQR